MQCSCGVTVSSDLLLHRLSTIVHRPNPGFSAERWGRFRLIIVIHPRSGCVVRFPLNKTAYPQGLLQQSNGELFRQFLDRHYDRTFLLCLVDSNKKLGRDEKYIWSENPVNILSSHLSSFIDSCLCLLRFWFSTGESKYWMPVIVRVLITHIYIDTLKVHSMLSERWVEKPIHWCFKYSLKLIARAHNCGMWRSGPVLYVASLDLGVLWFWHLVLSLDFLDAPMIMLPVDPKAHYANATDAQYILKPVPTCSTPTMRPSPSRAHRAWFKINDVGRDSLPDIEKTWFYLREVLKQHRFDVSTKDLLQTLPRN